MLRLMTGLLVFFAPFYLGSGYMQSAVEQRVIELATQQVQSACKQCDIWIETKWLPDNLRGVDPDHIGMLRFDEVGLPRGYQTASVEYTQDGTSYNRQVQLFATVKKKLPVINKRIEHNQKISAADLTWKRKDLTRMRKLPVFSIEKIAGKAAAGILQKGDMILPADLQQIPVVEVGDEVRMVYQKKGVKLAMNCTARQAKAEGERIRVYNKETRKTYIAKVVAPTKVIWEKTL